MFVFQEGANVPAPPNLFVWMDVDVELDGKHIVSALPLGCAMK